MCTTELQLTSQVIYMGYWTGFEPWIFWTWTREWEREEIWQCIFFTFSICINIKIKFKYICLYSEPLNSLYVFKKINWIFWKFQTNKSCSTSLFFIWCCQYIVTKVSETMCTFKFNCLPYVQLSFVLRRVQFWLSALFKMSGLTVHPGRVFTLRPAYIYHHINFRKKNCHVLKP